MKHEQEFNFSTDEREVHTALVTEVEQVADETSQATAETAKPAKPSKKEQAMKIAKENKSVIIAALVGAMIMFSGMQIVDAFSHSQMTNFQKTHSRR